MKNILILVALQEEIPAPLLSPHRVVYTGVGKVNAALGASAALAAYKPELVINYGSAGAVRPALSGLIECGSAVQRDMDLRPLGVPLGETYGDPGPHKEHWGPGPCVGTGDSFADGAPELPCDLVDMEAFVLARACRLAGICFECVKYVSDAANTDAPQDWEANKAKGAALFAEWIRQRVTA